MLHKIKKGSDIGEAKQFFAEFGKVLPKLYGKSCQTFTLHTLVKHLHQDAERHGSMTEHSMFSLESSLGHFTKFLKGYRGISLQFIESNLKIQKNNNKKQITTFYLKI